MVIYVSEIQEHSQILETAMHWAKTLQGLLPAANAIWCLQNDNTISVVGSTVQECSVTCWGESRVQIYFLSSFNFSPPQVTRQTYFTSKNSTCWSGQRARHWWNAKVAVCPGLLHLPGASEDLNPPEASPGTLPRLPAEKKGIHSLRPR